MPRFPFLPSRPVRSATVAVLLAATAGVSFAGNTAIEPMPRDAKWLERHEAFSRRAKQGGADVLFLGDSITDFWRDENYWNKDYPYRAGRAVWDANFSPLHALNFGIGADRTQHLLWRIQHGELAGLAPKVVVLLIGTNNVGLSRNTTDETIQGINAVVTNLRALQPNSRILLLGLLPRGPADDPLRPKLRAINAAIALLDDGQSIRYLEFGDRFLSPDRSIRPELMPDRLHPSEAGYQLWADAIKEPLARLLK